jgi:hypothetical protein
MPFWNPLIGGSKVLELEFSHTQAGVTFLDGGSYTSPTGPYPAYTLRQWAEDQVGGSDQLNAYKNVSITIPADYIIGGDTTSGALSLGDFSNQNVTLVNNGYIVGKSGASGSGAGGSAISVPNNISSFTIENNNIISGGGSGGANGSPVPGTVGILVGPDESSCNPSPVVGPGGAGGGGAGYTPASPVGTISPPVTTPSASFPLGSVTFSVGGGAGGGSSPAGTCPPTSPITGNSGSPGGKIGSTPSPSPTGSYIIGAGTTLTTIINNGNIYGPNNNPLGPNHSFGPQPAQP